MADTKPTSYAANRLVILLQHYLLSFEVYRFQTLDDFSFRRILSFHAAWQFPFSRQAKFFRPRILPRLPQLVIKNAGR